MSVVGGVGGTARGGQSDADVGGEDGEAGHRNAVVAAVADPSRRIGDLGRLRRDKRHATGGGRKAGGAKDSDNEEVAVTDAEAESKGSASPASSEGDLSNDPEESALPIGRIPSAADKPFRKGSNAAAIASASHTVGARRRRQQSSVSAGTRAVAADGKLPSAVGVAGGDGGRGAGDVSLGKVKGRSRKTRRGAPEYDAGNETEGGYPKAKVEEGGDEDVSRTEGTVIEGCGSAAQGMDGRVSGAWEYDNEDEEKKEKDAGDSNGARFRRNPHAKARGGGGAAGDVGGEGGTAAAPAAEGSDACPFCQEVCPLSELEAHVYKCLDQEEAREKKRRADAEAAAKIRERRGRRAPLIHSYNPPAIPNKYPSDPNVGGGGGGRRLESSAGGGAGAASAGGASTTPGATAPSGHSNDGGRKGKCKSSVDDAAAAATAAVPERAAAPAEPAMGTRRGRGGEAFTGKGKGKGKASPRVKMEPNRHSSSRPTRAGQGAEQEK